MTAMAHMVMWKLNGATAQALEAYNAHPEHLTIKEMLGPLRLARSQADFEISN